MDIKILPSRVTSVRIHRRDCHGNINRHMRFWWHKNDCVFFYNPSRVTSVITHCSSACSESVHNPSSIPTIFHIQSDWISSKPSSNLFSSHRPKQTLSTSSRGFNNKKHEWGYWSYSCGSPRGVCTSFSQPYSWINSTCTPQPFNDLCALNN